MTAIDPADFNVVSGAYKSIAQEMQDIMLRAAYSSLVREAKDCSTCVMDADAKTVAQAEATRNMWWQNQSSQPQHRC